MHAAEIEVAFNNSDIVFSLFSPFSPTRATLKGKEIWLKFENVMRYLDISCRFYNIS